MTTEDEHEKLLAKLAKIPTLEALLKSGRIAELLVSDEDTERAVLPYGGPPERRVDTWKMTRYS